MAFDSLGISRTLKVSGSIVIPVRVLQKISNVDDIAYSCLDGLNLPLQANRHDVEYIS